MASTDPIADLLVALCNASRVRHDRTTVPDSRMSRNILAALQGEGFIRSFRGSNGKGAARRVEVILAYGPKHECLLNGTHRRSRPGRRMYVGLDELKPLLRRLEVPLLSTPQGVMTGAQAFSRKTGGELLAVVW
jgi:small subunit ribosomal protein S8